MPQLIGYLSIDVTDKWINLERTTQINDHLWHILPGPIFTTKPY